MSDVAATALFGAAMVGVVVRGFMRSSGTLPTETSSSSSSSSGSAPSGGHGVLRSGSSADFPTDADGRVMHLQVKRGQLANRILSVGDAGRAERLATLFDGGRFVRHVSTRGFEVYTGRFESVPISIVVTGMGVAMIDFVVRESAGITPGEMAILRLGTCGGLGTTQPGNIVVASKGAVLLRREPDLIHYPEAATTAAPTATAIASTSARFGTPDLPYSVSRVVPADAAMSELYARLIDQSIRDAPTTPIDISAHRVTHGVGATGDSFYSSQGA